MHEHLTKVHDRHISFKPDQWDHLELVTTVTVKDPMENQVYGEKGGRPMGLQRTSPAEVRVLHTILHFFLKRGYLRPHFSDSPSTDQYSEPGYDVGLLRSSRVSSTPAHRSITQASWL